MCNSKSVREKIDSRTSDGKDLIFDQVDYSRDLCSAMGFPGGSDNKESACSAGVCVLSRFSRVRLSVTPWTAAHQAPLSM